MPNMHSNISFGLVNIPIVLNPVIKNNATSFNQLHDKCMHRISYVKYCPHCKKSIKEANIIKGYEYEKDKYVVFDKNELNSLKPENEKEIEWTLTNNNECNIELFQSAKYKIYFTSFILYMIVE